MLRPMKKLQMSWSVHCHGKPLTLTTVFSSMFSASKLIEYASKVNKIRVDKVSSADLARLIKYSAHHIPGMTSVCICSAALNV